MILLVLAAVLQFLLITELLCRRLVHVFIPGKRSAVQHFADTSVITTFLAACVQVLTIPVQALGSLLLALNRYTVLILVTAVLFAMLLLLSSTFVYMYTSVARIYNTGVAPVVAILRWIFILTDFVYRAFVPVYNASVFMLSQILTRIIVPFSFHNFDALPDVLQALLLAITTMAQTLVAWLQNIMLCTVRFQESSRLCGVPDLQVFIETQAVQDCTVTFASSDTQCYAAPNFLLLDLLTPGLYMRQAFLTVQDIIAGHCGLAALVLNLAIFPLSDHQLYAAVHTGVNALVYSMIGLPIATIRRCEYVSRWDFSAVAKTWPALQIGSPWVTSSATVCLRWET